MAYGGRRLTSRLAAAPGRCAPPGHPPVACQSDVCLRSYPVGPLGRSSHHDHGEPLHDRALVTEGPQFGPPVQTPDNGTCRIIYQLRLEGHHGYYCILSKTNTPSRVGRYVKDACSKHRAALVEHDMASLIPHASRPSQRTTLAA